MAETLVSKQRVPLRTTPQRSSLMSRVRRSGTDCEVALRRALRRAGFRYRLSCASFLPGRPDLILPEHRLAVFVDGCFWHGCPFHGSIPKSNRSFWLAKIRANRRRDIRVSRALRRLGWKVIRIWEHQIRDEARVAVARIGRRIA
jgi:DNA mismatch endonuclease, patch repair protein